MKKSKGQVDYSKGMEKSHCGPLSLYDKANCEHFIQQRLRSDGQCTKVAGKIERHMWCKLWKRASNDHEN